MIHLNDYLRDGADWQSRAILAYIQGNIASINDKTYVGEGSYRAEVLCARFDNVGGREHGYMVSVLYQYKEQKTIAFYEHRNSDNVYIIHSDEWFGFDTPNPEVLGKNYPSKWSNDTLFECGKIKECAEYIINELKKFVDECETKNSEI